MTAASNGGELFIVCLKTGDKYGDHYVNRLASMTARHLDRPHRFVCFTDTPLDGIDCRPPPCGLPGWWGKVGFFRPDLEIEGPFVYLDLDMLVVGDLGPLFETGAEFATIRQWRHVRAPKRVPGYNSSAMYFAEPGIRSEVWKRMGDGVTRKYRGDEDWLKHVYPAEHTFPDEWFAPMERCADGPPTGSRLVVCGGVVSNEEAVERYPWVRAAWQ